MQVYHYHFQPYKFLLNQYQHILLDYHQKYHHYLLLAL
nr:MAG TPA: hypothetical protein [Crassvirales sp.]